MSDDMFNPQFTETEKQSGQCSKFNGQPTDQLNEADDENIPDSMMGSGLPVCIELSQDFSQVARSVSQSRETSSINFINELNELQLGNANNPDPKAINEDFVQKGNSHQYFAANVPENENQAAVKSQDEIGRTTDIVIQCIKESPSRDSLEMLPPTQAASHAKKHESLLVSKTCCSILAPESDSLSSTPFNFSWPKCKSDQITKDRPVHTALKTFLANEKVDSPSPAKESSVQMNKNGAGNEKEHSEIHFSRIIDDDTPDLGDDTPHIEGDAPATDNQTLTSDSMIDCPKIVDSIAMTTSVPSMSKTKDMFMKIAKGIYPRGNTYL